MSWQAHDIEKDSIAEHCVLLLFSENAGVYAAAHLSSAAMTTSSR
jgi:hypothetical protein